MDELTALEKDIRIVDEDIGSFKKRTEEIDREIAGTSDPERIKALQQRLDRIDQKETMLLQQKLFFCKTERTCEINVMRHRALLNWQNK